MKLLEWIVANRPGSVSEYDDRYEIAHDSGEYSTLFKRDGAAASVGACLERLGDVYSVFDGADLFSSTFKIASIESPKSVEEVKLVESLQEFQSWVKQLNPKFPGVAIPFMYQAGIGVYAIDEESGSIYEWDDEQCVLSGEFDTLDEVLNEWLDAIT